MPRGLILFLVPLCFLASLAGCRQSESTLTFGGGPVGGTFHGMAREVAGRVRGELPQRRIEVERSGGSLVNLDRLQKGELDLALAFGGDVYLSSRGELAEDQPSATRIRALTRLYGAATHLVVREAGPILTPNDLVRRRLAIGSPGSGAAQSARRYLEAIGLWDRIIPVHVGYTMALQELRSGTVQGVWMQVAVPSESLLRFARQEKLRFLDLVEPAGMERFFSRYPFYSETRIPAGTYPGQRREMVTFQDAALWVAAEQVDPDWVYRALKALYRDSPEDSLAGYSSLLRHLDVDLGLEGVAIPLHPGAERFWRERGMLEERR